MENAAVLQRAESLCSRVEYKKICVHVGNMSLICHEYFSHTPPEDSHREMSYLVFKLLRISLMFLLDTVIKIVP